jgi:D-alanyl-D-alanine carboxypeptidase/D-alanyl-D-alanine-endopeptidase (penicillin-binding protein 4)
LDRALVQLRADVIEATRRPGVARGTWGILVHSIDRDEPILALNATSLLVPASLTKIVSVATASEAVGWDYRFETSVRAAGPVIAGTLRGDLIVAGTGDPSIGGRQGDALSVLAAGIQAAGIRRIEGRIVGDDDAVEEPRPQLSWAWDDLGYASGALFGALNFSENRTTVSVRAGASEGAPTSLGLDGPALPALVNRSVTGAPGSPLLVWPEHRPGELFLTVAGSVPAGSAPVTLGVSVGNPTLWFAHGLRSRLVEAGVEVAGVAVDIDDLPTPPDRSRAMVVFTYRSPPLGALARPLLKDSINLYGEAFLRLNAPAGAFPTNDAALGGLVERLRSWGLPDGSYQFVDGSGLSRRNAVSPEALLTVLRRMYDPDGSSPFMAALPVAGVDGSLEDRMKGTAAENNVRAKTGTMSNVRGLAGYVATSDGERLAFVVMVNNFEGAGAAAHAAIDEIAARLAAFRRR